jgi:hypothetical protein
MKTRRTTDGTAARMTDTGIRAIGASIVSLRTTDGDKTKHRMGPGPGPSVQPMALSHDRIAERARAIWLARGCSPDHDHENWCDAEAQLKAELEVG